MAFTDIDGKPVPGSMPRAVLPVRQDAPTPNYYGARDSRSDEYGFEAVDLDGSTPIGASKGNRVAGADRSHLDPQPFANLRGGRK